MKTTFEAEGSIRGVDLLAAFVSIWREGTSGSLLFSRGAASAGFDLEAGEIVAVSSSEPRFETAAILIRAGKLDGAAVERLSIPPGTDAALAALQAGILTRREWKWGEKIRAIEVLADLLAWPDGTYIFDALAQHEPGEFALAVPRLLLELFLRSRDRHLIEHQLGSTDVPLLRSESFDEEFATFGLTADAESVVRLIDGGATASEISERAPAEEFAVLKLLAALKTLGLLRAGSPARPGEVSPLEEVEAPSLPETPTFEAWSAPQAAQIPETEPEPLAALRDMELEEAAVGMPENNEEDRDWIASQAREAGDAGPQVPTTWEEEPMGSDWAGGKGELDRPLASGSEPPSAGERRGSRWGLIAGLLFVLTAAVVVLVLLRSRTSPREPVVVASARPTPAQASASLSPVAATPAPTLPVAPTSSPAQRAARESTAAPIAKAPATPAPRATPARVAAADTARVEWLERARRDQRRLRSEKKSRYAIQLELACEVPSLVEAWKHDRPAGSMWLLTAPHGGRDCFRVLWGRYGSLEEARGAKGEVPSFFTTPTNHPAVVLVR